jgi:hypothetical protein
MISEKEKYRQQILELQEELNNENRAYFDSFYERMAVHILAYKEEVMVETVYTLLLDLLDAQSNGETASAYFGMNPQTLGKKMLERMQREKPRYMMKIAAFILVSGLFWSYFSDIKWFSAKPYQFSWVVYLLDTIIYLIFAVLFYRIMQLLIGRKILSYVTLWLILCLMIGTFVLTSLFLKDFQAIAVPALRSKIAGGVLLVIYVIGAFKWYQSMK